MDPESKLILTTDLGERTLAMAQPTRGRCRPVGQHAV
jgi:hypothetical protein